MFPVIIPHPTFDGYLSANLAIALTGMGVDMGADLCMDFESSELFDNQKVNELNGLYVSGKITLSKLGAMLREYVESMTYPAGFKFTVGPELLEFYRDLWPEMTLVVGLTSPQTVRDEIISACLALAEPNACLTLAGCMLARQWADRSIAMATERIPTLHIPFEMFDTPETRPRALKRLAEWIGGKAAGGEVGRMVEGAHRKLSYVYDEGERRANNRQHDQANSAATADDNGKNANRRTAKTRG